MKLLLQEHTVRKIYVGDTEIQKAHMGDTLVFQGEEEYTFTLPVIISAAFSKNPTDINTELVISVSVEEQTIALKPTFFYSDEIYSGEVI